MYSLSRKTKPNPNKQGLLDMYKTLDDRARMGSLAERCPLATKDKPCIHRCHKLIESIMKKQIIIKNDGWEIKFAWLPVIFDEWITKPNEEEERQTTTIIWLEKYWCRFEGLYNNVRRFEDKPTESEEGEK